MTPAPPFELIHTRFSEKEWRFEASELVWAATEEFDGILETARGTGKLGAPLRAFLKRYPWHFDALTHYAMLKYREGKKLEAYAFAHAAVGTARSYIPREFDPKEHTIPGGFVENRPFLRCLYNLMLCCEALGDAQTASAIGFEILDLDHEDRMGARMELPKHLLRLGRYQAAADLFESDRFSGTFHRANYLYPLLLFHLGREKDAMEAIENCLRTPQVARYLLEPMASQPPSDSPIGGFTSGSELKGYWYAREYLPYWLDCDNALKLLLKASHKVEKAGWPRYYSKV